MQQKPSSKFSQQIIKAEALKYEKRSEFRDGSPTFYRAAIRYGWLDEVCSHMVIRKQWTFEAVKREARRYKTRSEFRNSAGSAYSKALREGWLDEVSKHMKLVRNIAYTKEEVIQEAAKYRYRSDFKANASGHYQRARRQRWLDDVCEHMSIRTDGGLHCAYGIINERLNKVYIGITRQNLSRRIANHKSKKNSTFSRFIVGEPDTEIKQLSDYIYTADDVQEYVERKFIEDYLNLGYEVLNSEKVIGAIGYKEAIWTKSALQKEAAKYKSRKEFQVGNSSAYATATRRSDFAEITSHMSYMRHSWNKEKVAKISLQYKTKASFKQASPSAYLHARLNGFLDEVCRHMEPVNITWNKGLVFREAKKFKSRDQFRLKASGAYKWAVRHKCLEDVCKHMMPLRTIWQLDSLRIEAKKYETRSEFAKHNSGAYVTALKMGVLDDICVHMSNGLRVAKKWTKEAIKHEARKHLTRSAFKNSAVGAYNRARIMGWLDEVCQHM